MIEIKKTYQQPEMKVVEINDADIICTSGDVNGDFYFSGPGDIERGEW